MMCLFIRKAAITLRLLTTQQSILFALFFIIASGCHKDGGIETEHLNLPQNDIPLQVNRVRAILKNDADFRNFWNNSCGQLGTPLWTEAMPFGNPDQIQCLIPITSSKDEGVKAVAIVSIADSIRVKFITPSKVSSAFGELPGKEDMILHFFNHKLRNQQPLVEKGIRFLDKGLSENTDGNLTTDVKAPYVLSVCYTVTVCTGDGFGNCTGNYRYYTDCYTSTYWMESYDYRGPVSGGGGDYEGGTRPGTGGSSGAINYLMPPVKGIYNLDQYLSCFNPGLGGKLSIYVDQPLPGSTEPFTILGKMGHVFVALEQVVDGTTIRRYFGFHPSEKVNPFGKKSAQSILGNDEGRIHDVYINYELGQGQFAAVITAIKEYHEVYDLEEYNCTDFAIDVAEAGGITLPRTTAWWILGRGRNPGSFGEDLRKQPLAVSKYGRASSNIGSCP